MKYSCTFSSANVGHLNMKLLDKNCKEVNINPFVCTDEKPTQSLVSADSGMYCTLTYLVYNDIFKLGTVYPTSLMSNRYRELMCMFFENINTFILVDRK